jgi:hypothetical protein
MGYKFLKDGKEIQCEKEVWCWEAYFNDGTVLKQFGDDGIFHQLREIDESKLDLFRMVSDSFPQIYSVPFNPDEMKLIHFYRIIRLNVYTPQFKEIKCYCFGFEKKRSRSNEKHFIVILPSGEVILTENPDIINFE